MLHLPTRLKTLAQIVIRLQLPNPPHDTAAWANKYVKLLGKEKIAFYLNEQRISSPGVVSLVQIVDEYVQQRLTQHL